MERVEQAYNFSISGHSVSKTKSTTDCNASMTKLDAVLAHFKIGLD